MKQEIITYTQVKDKSMNRNFPEVVHIWNLLNKVFKSATLIIKSNQREFVELKNKTIKI